jgi:homoserine dehydrogenase
VVHVSDRPVCVAILGCGNVGEVVAKRLIHGADAIAARSGIRFTVAHIGVRDVKKKRSAEIPVDLITDDLNKIVKDPSVDVVIEVMGGIDPARELILSALRAHKPVVTANKELLATHPEVLEEAAQCGVDLLFEAAVGGGIPVIRPLRESLAGERVTRVLGIVNGTTNFILSSMTETQSSYENALAEAQKLGYAEPDPSADVQGRDAAAKAAILASLAFGVRIVLDDVYCEGIENITEKDIEAASARESVIKLLAIVEQNKAKQVSARVQPTLVPKSHPLSSVHEAFNAIFIEGEGVGELMLYGRGAGGEPTASSVLGDVLDAAHNLRAGGTGRTPQLEPAKLVPYEETRSSYFLDFLVRDRPGVLAAIATVFGNNNVSIQSVEQTSSGDEARLGMVTHQAREGDVQETVRELNKLEVVMRVDSMLRMLS